MYLRALSWGHYFLYLYEWSQIPSTWYHIKITICGWPTDILPSTIESNPKWHASFNYAAHVVSIWAELNLFSLNAKKNKAIVFGTSYTVRLFKRLGILDIKMNSKDDTAPFVDEPLSLCVILDDTLSWKKQVNHVSLVNRVIYSFSFIRSCTS